MVARRLVGLRVGDDPHAWEAAGFHVQRQSVRVGGVTLHLTGQGEPRGVTGWRLDPPVDAPIDGLSPCTVTDEPAAAPDAHPTAHPDAHPNGATALDHLVVATADLERTTSALTAVGITPRRTVVGAQGDAAVSYRFFLLGTCLLELIGPTAPDPDDPGAAEPARFVGLAFTTDRLDDLGDLATPPKPAVQPGRRIATLRTHDLDISVPVAFLTPRRPAGSQQPR